MNKNPSNTPSKKNTSSSKTKKDVVSRKEVLLFEYKEIVSTLRSWDTLLYGMLTVVGTITAAIIASSMQSKSSIAWGVILGIFLFWLFTYLWITRLAEVRVDILIEIEEELEMMGQYTRLRKMKQLKRFVVWVFLPYLSAFIFGPILGYIINNPQEVYQNIASFINSMKSLFQ